VSRDTPAHARRGSRGDDGASGSIPAADPAEQPATVATALRGLAPPRHAPTFWTDLDSRLADEPQLRLAPRSAIRPITQPPPVIDDKNLASSLKGDGPPPRRSSRRTVIGVAVVLLAALGVVAALQNPDDPSGDDGDTETATETSGGRTPTSDEPSAETTAPATTVAPGTIDPSAPMTPRGVGPLTIGTRMSDLQLAGMNIQPDQRMYRSSGGTCYVARVAGALDLELRFRAPDGQSRADEPSEGVLAAITIQSGLPTGRRSDTGLALGSTQDQVLAAYGGNLDDREHPFVAGGHIFRADNGDGTGIAFQTDGSGVIGITVGEMDAIRFVHECG
jgi:hypothetical protein